MKACLFLIRNLCLIFSLLLIPILTFCQQTDNALPEVDTTIVNTLIAESESLIIIYQAEKALNIIRGGIMESFYNELSKGLSKDKALQKAKLNYIKKNKGLKAHPFYWAAFIGIGDMSKIEN